MDEPAGVVRISAKPGREEELLRVLTAMAAAARLDEGAEIYAVHRGRRDPSEFFIYELYRDKDALRRHGANEALQALGKEMGEMTTSVDVLVGNLVAGDRAVR